MIWLLDGANIVLLIAILTAVKTGFNQVIRGLESIDEKLSRDAKE